MINTLNIELHLRHDNYSFIVSLWIYKIIYNDYKNFFPRHLRHTQTTP